MDGHPIGPVPPQSYPVQAIIQGDIYVVPSTELFTTPKPTTDTLPTLDATILQLPTSLSQLLNDVDLLIPEQELQEALSTSAPLYLASDGGAAAKKGSYGWVLQAGNPLIAKGKGTAQGQDPRSFRAKGYGMSSGLLYLLQIHLVYGITRGQHTRN